MLGPAPSAVRYHREAVPAEVRRDTEPLVDHRPEHAIRAPGLHHHGPLGEQPVDVRPRSQCSARSPALHLAFPRSPGRAGTGHCPALELLLVVAEPTVVALTHRGDRGIQVKMLRPLGTAETTESQLSPGLPARAEVGPVPVWNRPNFPV